MKKNSGRGWNIPIKQATLNQSVYKSVEKNVVKAFEEGRKCGIREAAPTLVKSFYAAAILTLKKQHKFGQKRLISFLKECDETWMLCVSDEELVEQALKETDIEIRANEVFTDDRIDSI